MSGVGMARDEINGVAGCQENTPLVGSLWTTRESPRAHREEQRRASDGRRERSDEPKAVNLPSRHLGGLDQTRILIFLHRQRLCMTLYGCRPLASFLSTPLIIQLRMSHSSALPALALSSSRGCKYTRRFH
jgi:hypothetical protein